MGLWILVPWARFGGADSALQWERRHKPVERFRCPGLVVSKPCDASALSGSHPRHLSCRRVLGSRNDMGGRLGGGEHRQKWLRAVERRYDDQLLHPTLTDVDSYP